MMEEKVSYLPFWVAPDGSAHFNRKEVETLEEALKIVAMFKPFLVDWGADIDKYTFFIKKVITRRIEEILDLNE